ncbi:YbiU family protein [Escherichia coli]
MLSYADIKAGHVTAEQREQIKRRGCAVIKGHFPREQALGWISRCWTIWTATALTRSTKAPAIISSGRSALHVPDLPHLLVAGASQARQSEEMANAQSFLNRLWTFESDGESNGLTRM